MLSCAASPTLPRAPRSASRRLWADRTSLCCAIALAIAGPATAAAPPEHLWSRGFSASPVDTFSTFVVVTDILADPTGGVVIVGYFHGSVDFGAGGTVSRSFVSDWAGADVYAAKFDASGNCAWSRVLLRLNEFLVHSEIIHSLAVDAGGNLIMVGTVNGPVDLVDATLTSTFIDAFAAKYGPNDGLLWARRFGITGPLGNSADGVAVDGDDNMVVIGSFSGRVDFGGGVIQPFGGTDVFLAKLDPGGAHVWTHRYGGTNDQRGRSVAIDDAGHIQVAGTFLEPLDLGGGALVDGNFFTAELDASATHIRSDAIRVDSGGFGWYLNALLLDETGSLCMVGGVGSNSFIIIGGQTLYGPLGFSAFFDPSGAHRWHSTWESNRDVDVSFNGDSVDTFGGFAGTLDIGGQLLVSVGERDAYIARFDPNGAPMWARSFGGPGGDRAGATLAGADGELWVGGDFGDGIDFGDGSLAGSGMYLAKFGRRPPTPVLVLSLIPRGQSIEIQWTASGEIVLDEYRLLRHHPSQSEPVTVASGSIGSGEGSYVDHGVRPGQRYQYELAVTTSAGDEYRSSLVTATVPVFANQLAQNAPNPFNPATSIAYSLSDRATVAVSIYDVAGVLIRRIDQGVRDAGEYAVEWDGRDDAGIVVGTGVYFYRLDGVAGVAPKKMVLLK